VVVVDFDGSAAAHATPGPAGTFAVEANGATDQSADHATDDATDRAAAAPPGAVPSPAVGSTTQIDLPLQAEPAAVMPGDIRTEPADMPGFVREADRAARWRRPWVRAAMAVACLVAAAALAGQWALAQRDLVAARHAALKPLLAAACAALGCELRAPRVIEALRVEASGVVRAEGNRSDLYKLTVTLRNLRGHEVALPAFELALTDVRGQLIARRVLRAGEIGARAQALEANAELMLQATVQVTSGTVAGYTIELFYP